MNFFFVTANRHDRDRVEVQLGFDGEMRQAKNYEYEVDIQLMFPKSFGLSMNFDKEQVREQFQSHLRLHTHAGSPQNPTKLERVLERLELLTHQLSEESLRFFALEIEAYLKFEIKGIKKLYRKGANTGTSQSEELLSQLESTHKIIEDYRKLLKQRHLEKKRAKDFPFDSFDHDLLLLDEYISHLYVSFISNSKIYCDSHPSLYSKITVLSSYAKQEADHRMASGYFLQADHDDAKEGIEEEHYLRRASLLKKYFQKILFIKATRSSRESRLLIPVYGLSAAIAATFAILVQVYQMDRSTQNFGISTIAFISIAVFAYVVKDILKDYFRKYFFLHSQRFFPDYNLKLSYVHNSKSKRLGEVDEYINLVTTKQMTDALRKIRFTSRDLDLEPEVEEDIIGYRKRFKLNLSSLQLREHYIWGLREVLRITLDRYTTSMDDPTKMLHLLRQDGSIESHLGHRVYYLHMSVSVAPIGVTTSETEQGTFKLFQIKMDKTGVLSVETIKKSTPDPTAQFNVVSPK